MGISQTTTAVMVFLTGLLPASCHKDSAKSKPAASALVAGTNATASGKSFDRNLGEITLTNKNETCLQLANGESCTLTPKVLDRHTVSITLTIESKDDYGETHDFAATQVIAKPGKAMEVAVGDLNLTFTPRIASE